MKHFSAIVLIGLHISAILTAGAFAETNELPPYTPPPPPLPNGMTYEEWQASLTNAVLVAGEPYWIDDAGATNYIKTYPFLLVTGVDTNGKSIMVAPPDWMLAGPPKADPHYKVTAMHELGGEIVEIEIRVSGDQGFFQGGLEMGTELILNGLNDKFIAQVPHANQTNETAITIPESIIATGAGVPNANGTYNKSSDLAGSLIEWKNGFYYIWRLSSSGEWHISQGPTSPKYTHPDTGNNIPPKSEWIPSLGSGSAPTLSY